MISMEIGFDYKRNRPRDLITCYNTLERLIVHCIHKQTSQQLQTLHQAHMVEANPKLL